MARNQLARIAASMALASVAILVASVPGASAKTYSFKPVKAKNGTVQFQIKRVRPASVVSARIRVGGRHSRRLKLTRARRAARSGHLRLRVTPAARKGGGGHPETMHLKRRGRLKIFTDTTPPGTEITSGPTGTVSSQSATFGFGSSDSGANFQCSRDSGSWSRCNSPKSYFELSAGPHTLSVRAYDSSGNVDPTPAIRTWTVEIAPPPPVADVEPAPAGTLLYDGFGAANGPGDLITNEYAAWRSWDTTAVQSPVWRSDGGSLFSVAATDASGQPGRVAYTGKLDSSPADRYSQTYTHSNKMRFWTKASGFEDVRIDAEINPLSWSPDAPSTWGGFKFYVRRKEGITESPFYTVEPFIKDGHVYIQKKCLGDTGGGNYSTGGTYYLLASRSGLNVTLGSWATISATARTNADRSVTIGLYRNGSLLVQAVDHGIRADGTGCAPLYGGHVGFRSDSFQYYLDNYTVTPLS